MNRTHLMNEFRSLSFKQMCSRSGLACYGLMSKNESAEKAGEYLGVSKKTALRYISGKPVPEPILKLLEFKYNGFIPQDGIWKGYFIHSNTEELVSPEGQVITPEEIKMIFMRKWIKESQQSQIRQLNEKVEELKTMGSEHHQDSLVEIANNLLQLAGKTNLLKTA